MRRRKPHVASAMTDIAFLLLLFFLIFSITTHRVPSDVTLAASETAEIADDHQLILAVDADGNVYTGDQIIAIADIAYVPVVSVYADEAVPFSALYPLLQHLQENGVPTVQCVVRPK